MRVLVCGGRDYTNKQLIYATLDQIRDQIGLLVTGNDNKKGADGLAQRYCIKHGIPCAAFPAPWGKHRKAAGPIRNGWMLKYMKPHLVVAFPGGRGTSDLKSQAQELDIRIWQIDDLTYWEQ